jgi:parallel beta-helix repeat protein
MRRLLGPFVVAVLGAATLAGLSAAQALANHVQCGDVITQDTTLDSDLIDCPGVALVVGADNITLDLAGHTISAPSSAITGEGHRGVAIENGRVRGDGIELSDVHQTRLSNLELARLLLSHSTQNRVANSSINGGDYPVFELDDSDYNLLQDSGVIGYSTGAYLDVGSDYNRIEHSFLHGPEGTGVVIAGNHNRIEESDVYGFTGIVLNGADSNRVIGNTGAGEDQALLLYHSDKNLVEGNAFPSSFYCVICLDGSNGNLIRGNALASAYADVAIRIEGSENRIERNDASGSRSGIGVFSGAGNTLLRNRADQSVGDPGYLFYEGDGIFAKDEATDTLLKGNVANRNADDGIDVRDPTSRLIHNTANDNDDLGIEAVPGVFGVANRAFGNGNPLQCLNVFCKTNGRPR